jgi:hypothetical protein
MKRQRHGNHDAKKVEEKKVVIEEPKKQDDQDEWQEVGKGNKTSIMLTVCITLMFMIELLMLCLERRYVC